MYSEIAFEKVYLKTSNIKLYLCYSLQSRYNFDERKLVLPSLIFYSSGWLGLEIFRTKGVSDVQEKREGRGWGNRIVVFFSLSTISVTPHQTWPAG